MNTQPRLFYDIDLDGSISQPTSKIIIGRYGGTISYSKQLTPVQGSADDIRKAIYHFYKPIIDGYFDDNGERQVDVLNKSIEKYASSLQPKEVQGSAEEILDRHFKDGFFSDFERLHVIGAMHEYASSLTSTGAAATQGYSLEDMEKCWDEAILSFSKSIGNDVLEEEAEAPIFKNVNDFIKSLNSKL